MFIRIGDQIVNFAHVECIDLNESDRHIWFTSGTKLPLADDRIVEDILAVMSPISTLHLDVQNLRLGDWIDAWNVKQLAAQRNAERTRLGRDRRSGHSHYR